MRKMRFFPHLNLKIIEILLEFFEREAKKGAPKQSELKQGGFFLFSFHRRMRFRNIKNEGIKFYTHLHSFSHPYQVLLREPLPLS